MDKSTTTEEKEKKEPLFSFTKLNKYYIFPFLSPVCCFLNNTFLTLILENDDKQLDKGFLFSLHANLTYLIGGLLYFISWIRTKTKKSIDNIDKRASSKKYEYIYNDQLQKGGLKKFLIFTILTLILLFINFHSIFNRDRNVFE